MKFSELKNGQVFKSGEVIYMKAGGINDAFDLWPRKMKYSVYFHFELDREVELIGTAFEKME